MINLKTIKGDNLNIAVQDVKIELFDGSFYEITEADKLTFSLALGRDSPLIVRKYPGEIERVGETVIIKISNSETEKLKCFSYDFDLKIDMKGKGENIYTIVNGQIEVLPTAGGGG